MCELHIDEKLSSTKNRLLTLVIRPIGWIFCGLFTRQDADAIKGFVTMRTIDMFVANASDNHALTSTYRSAESPKCVLSFSSHTALI